MGNQIKSKKQWVHGLSNNVKFWKNQRNNKRTPHTSNSSVKINSVFKKRSAFKQELVDYNNMIYLTSFGMELRTNESKENEHLRCVALLCADQLWSVVVCRLE